MADPLIVMPQEVLYDLAEDAFVVLNWAKRMGFRKDRQLEENVKAMHKTLSERRLHVAALTPDKGGVTVGEAERIERLEAALREIKALKPQPIGDSGFVTGPLALLQAAQRIARAALRPDPETGGEPS